LAQKRFRIELRLLSSVVLSVIGRLQNSKLWANEY